MCDFFVFSCVCFKGFNPEIGKLGAGVRTSSFDTEMVEINTTDESYIHLPKNMIEVSQVNGQILGGSYVTLCFRGGLFYSGIGGWSLEFRSPSKR